MRCWKCHRNFRELPYLCHYCNKYFCSRCRLPEEHNCKGLKKDSLFLTLKNKSYTKPEYETSEPSIIVEPERISYKEPRVHSRPVKSITSKLLEWSKSRKYPPYHYSSRIGFIIQQILFLLISVAVLWFVSLYFAELNGVLLWFIPVGWIVLIISILCIFKFSLELLKELPNWYKRQINIIKVIIIVGIVVLAFHLYQNRASIQERYFEKASFNQMTEKVLSILSSSASKLGIGERNVTIIEQTIISEVNRERNLNSLHSLREDKSLSRLARGHSQDMINRDFYSHINPDGEDPTDRAIRQGISVYHGMYYGIAENIAAIYLGNDADCASYDETELGKCLVTKWMNSAGHRSNILNSGYSIIGVGVACDISKCDATQNFA